MNVTVFGLGFVGLTTALGFAHLGYKVYGVDVDETRKNILRGGKLPFLEPHMDEVLKTHLDKNFFIAEDIQAAVADSEVIFYLRWHALRRGRQRGFDLPVRGD